MINLKASYFTSQAKDEYNAGFDPIDSMFHYVVCGLPRGVIVDGVDIGRRFSIDAAHRSDGTIGEVTRSSSDLLINGRRLDNRLNTFYGSTYEIPLSDYTVYPEAYRFWICGDTHTVCPQTTMSLRLADNDPWGIFSYDSIEAINLYKITDVISVSYPNAEITEFGVWSSYSAYTGYYDDSVPLDIFMILSQLNTLVNSIDSTDREVVRSVLPTHILLGGIEHAMLQNDFTTVGEYVKHIYRFCRFWGIRLVIVNDPYYLNSSYYDDLNSFFMLNIADDCLLDLYAWASTREWQDLWPSHPGASDTQYNDFVYNYICDKTIEKWQLPIYREKYYVSFVSEKITSESYNDFMKNPSLGHGGGISGVSQSYQKIPVEDETQYQLGKYGSVQAPNLFMNTGYRFVVVVHTGYSDTLWANEQFQANTNYEFLCQTDTCGESLTGRNLINTLPVRLYRPSGAELAPYHSTVYPGTGAPWFVTSTENVDDYAQFERHFKINGQDVSVDFAYCTCWVTFFDNYCCTISIKFNGNHRQLDNWQSISFGRFPKKTSNQAFSLYCAGGSLGISNDIYVYVPISGGNKTYVSGNSYDLDFHNICWAHSATLLSPTKFNDANTSNFRVLSAEGTWKNIYAKTQSTTVVPYPTAGPPPDYATILGNLHDMENTADHVLFPTFVDDSHMDSSIYLYTHGYNNITGRNFVYDTYELYSMQLIPVSIFLADEKDHFESFHGETIPGVFYTVDYEIGSGEFIAEDGSIYLIIPQGWDGRLTSYEYYDSAFGNRFKVLNDPWESCEVVDLYDDYTVPRVENRCVVRTKLVVRIK